MENMCLAVPGKIIKVYENHAMIDINGIQKRINIQLIDRPSVSDYVLVHAGYAINIIDQDYYDFLNVTYKRMLEDYE